MTLFPHTGKTEVLENQYGSSSEEDADETDKLFTEDDTVIPSKPICVDDLWNYIKEMKSTNGLHKEYEVRRDVGRKEGICEIAVCL